MFCDTGTVPALSQSSNGSGFTALEKRRSLQFRSSTALAHKWSSTATSSGFSRLAACCKMPWLLSVKAG